MLILSSIQPNLTTISQTVIIRWNYTLNKKLFEINMNAKNSILQKVNAWFETENEALNWYNNTVIPSFGMSPREFIEHHGEQGKKDIFNYINSKELGGFE